MQLKKKLLEFDETRLVCYVECQACVYMCHHVSSYHEALTLSGYDKDMSKAAACLGGTNEH